MKKLILASVLALSAVAAMAQMSDPPTEAPTQAPDAVEDQRPGRSLMEEGAKLLLRGLLSEAEPAMRDLQEFADQMGPAMKSLTDQMGPALADIMAMIDDIKNYSAPELLPNGDIIIRRAPDAPTFVPSDPPQEIEL
ncbi:hypothetical protein [Loktanella salsilacus]|uniref:hypothetical protein n=1 Tax=Loktanella salsilacus TaxID=195913 RepID=UPI0037360DA9